jgi:hypothetical protein
MGSNERRRTENGEGTEAKSSARREVENAKKRKKERRLRL